MRLQGFVGPPEPSQGSKFKSGVFRFNMLKKPNMERFCSHNFKAALVNLGVLGGQARLQGSI